MRKIFLIISFMIFGISAKALDITEGFTYSKSFWQNTLSLSQDISYTTNIGFNFDLTEHDDISNHIYTFSLPLMVRLKSFGLLFRPFIIPDNANEASAKGAKVSWTFGIKYDEVEQTSSHVFLSLGFADQYAYVFKTGLPTQKDNFYQLVYDGGIVLDYFGAYLFEISGNMFQYLSGISSVEGVAGVLDQQNLASLDTLAYVLALPKGSAGLKITWNSQESRSENTLSYRFIDFYEKEMSAWHSLKFSSKIAVMDNLFINLVYNHLFISSQKDEDIFKGAILLRL